MAHTARAYPGFCSMKPTRSIATPPGWDASPLQVTPSILLPVAIYTPGWREALWESSVLHKNTTQWSRPVLKPRPLDLELGHHISHRMIFKPSGVGRESLSVSPQSSKIGGKSFKRTLPGNGCTLDIPSLDGEEDRGLLVGDLDLDLRGFGRAKEVKSRFSNKLPSLWRTRKCLLWFTTVSSGLGVLVSLRRDGEGERDMRFEPEGLIDRRLVANELFVRRSSTPESWN